MNLFKLIPACLFVFSFTSFANQFIPEQAPSLPAKINLNQDDLCQVADNTLNYMKAYPNDSFAVHRGEVPTIISMKTVEQSLRFICQVAREDKNNEESRLTDANFVKQHFDFYRWLPDKITAHDWAQKSDNKVKKRLLNNIPADKLFITKYYVKMLDGSDSKNATYQQALYALPKDETSLSPAQAQQRSSELTRFKYTRQQVMKGVLDEGALAKPLIWLTESGLHDVLLQGTGVLNVDGKKRYFNVHRNNGIAYDYTLGKTEQARYWYFAEVPGIMGYGTDIDNKIPILPQVTFAGNVKQLGLGKLFLTSYKVNGEQTSQIGVLADQGGAFDGNLFQLDLLSGAYYGWKDYYQANKHLPDYVDTWLIVLKPQFVK